MDFRRAEAPDCPELAALMERCAKRLSDIYRGAGIPEAGRGFARDADVDQPDTV